MCVCLRLLLAVNQDHDTNASYMLRVFQLPSAVPSSSLLMYTLPYTTKVLCKDIMILRILRIQNEVIVAAVMRSAHGKGGGGVLSPSFSARIHI